MFFEALIFAIIVGYIFKGSIKNLDSSRINGIYIAFAAFAVITAGIGVPFVIAQGGNPVIVAALGLTAGYCGTLMTPMAANFNIMPTAILDIEDRRYGIIKYQAPVAIVMLLKRNNF
jgi:uncharacterized membrane protein